MGYDLKRFEAGDPVLGVQNNTRNFNPNLTISSNSYNTSTGIQRGQGPRFGISPIPFHSQKETALVDGSTTFGLQQSEDGGGAFDNRVKVFGVVPLTFGISTSLSTKKQHYVWIVTDSSNHLHFTIASIYTNTGQAKMYATPDLYAGLGHGIVSGSGAAAPNYTKINYPDSTTLFAYLSISSTLNAVSFASMTISGRNFPMKWIIGGKVAVGDSTHTATANFNDYSTSTFAYVTNGGTPPEYNYGTYQKNVRQLKFYNLYDKGSSKWALGYEYDYSDQAITASTFITGIDASSAASYALTGTATAINRLDGVTPAFSTVKAVLMNDDSAVCNSSYQAIFAAPGKAVMRLYQDWFRSGGSFLGELQQFIDPTSLKNVPQDLQSTYTEDTLKKSSCWQFWPPYVTGTALPKDSASAYDGVITVTLGEANSGILRKNTIYEITFSLFDKSIGLESNVGKPARFLTGTDDFVALSLFRDKKSGGIFLQNTPQAQFADAGLTFPIPGLSDTNFTPINYLEFRVYYRQLGTFEWLPALFIDAPNAIYNPNHKVLWACQGAIAALPGGQPGAFNDYSPLVSDSYFDVTVYQNRAFWCSEKNVVFSLPNNPLAYPLRNSVPCPNGAFKGTIVHNFYGQAQQFGRLVIFGSEATYSAVFTGNTIEQPVQVSPDTIGSFALDGSDFVVDIRTSITAFSSRSAVVAEGMLYFWGPTGVYKDNGVDIPEKVSLLIEPDIFTVYDPNKVTDIHCVFREETKEIEWFYTAKGEANGYTRGLILNTRSGEFFYSRYNGKIDWSQKISIDNGVNSYNTTGSRTIIGARSSASSTLQRAYFYDYRNRAGDIFPTGEFLVKTVATPSAGTLRFTLAAGYDSTAFTAIALGDRIALDQSQDYSLVTTTQDFIGIVAAKGAGTLDITLPSTSTWTYTGTLANTTYFPLYHAAKNQFAYVYESEIWCPGGMNFWAYWQFLHMLFKVNLLPSAAAQTVTLSYRTPLSSGYTDNILTLTDNSLGNFQVYTQLKSVNQAFEGQGVRLKLAGNQLGSSWILQYLAMDGRFVPGDNLMTYEG